MNAYYVALASTGEYGSPDQIGRVWVQIVTGRGTRDQDNFEFTRPELLTMAAVEYKGVSDASRAGLFAAPARFHFERALGLGL